MGIIEKMAEQFWNRWLTVGGISWSLVLILIVGIFILSRRKNPDDHYRQGG
jgi:hypothetical protein